MSDDPHIHPTLSTDDQTTALFVQMVFQLSSLATMLLGKAPHPETGKTMKDLDAARVVIDQLDMLERKTKGNLSKGEEQLLRGTLTDLRMAYVEATNAPASKPDAAPEPKQESPPAKEAEAAQQTEESKVKFTKKY